MFRALHNPDHHNYRRSICRHWKRNGGVCERGVYCNFAHGPREIQGDGQGGGHNSMKNVVTRGKETNQVTNPLCPSNDIQTLTTLTGGYVKVAWTDIIPTE